MQQDKVNTLPLKGEEFLRCNKMLFFVSLPKANFHLHFVQLALCQTTGYNDCASTSLFGFVLQFSIFHFQFCCISAEG